MKSAKWASITKVMEDQKIFCGERGDLDLGH
jgi:hypothetical protein